jgi:hypothetical protein
MLLLFWLIIKNTWFNKVPKSPTRIRIQTNVKAIWLMQKSNVLDIDKWIKNLFLVEFIKVFLKVNSVQIQYDKNINPQETKMI